MKNEPTVKYVVRNGCSPEGANEGRDFSISKRSGRFNHLTNSSRAHMWQQPRQDDGHMCAINSERSNELVDRHTKYAANWWCLIPAIENDAPPQLGILKIKKKKVVH